MKRTKRAMVSASALAFAAASTAAVAVLAAANPKVEPTECELTEVVTCEVYGPSAGDVAASAT